MKKLRLILYAICFSAILTILPIQSMENHAQCAAQAEEYNDTECPFTCLPDEKLIEIFPYCLSDNEDTVASLENSIKTFMAINTTCKRFNRFLTLELIREFCKNYTMVGKNKTLQNFKAFHAEKYNNNECSLTSLFDKRLLDIFSFCHSYYKNSTLCLHESIKNFMKTSMVCKKINRLLTPETIGHLCETHHQVHKDSFLQKLIAGFLHSIPATILVCAGANPNQMYVGQYVLEQAMRKNDKRLITTLLKHGANPHIFTCDKYYSMPVFFYAKTVEIAQMFIDKGIDVDATDKNEKLNVLWYILNYDYPSDVLKLYLEHEVDATLICSSNHWSNGCLLHALANRFCYGKGRMNEFLKKSRLLLNVIPHMVNTLNSSGKTPLDVAHQEFKRFIQPPTEYYEAIEDLEASFRALGGLTVQELTEKNHSNFKFNTLKL